MSYVLAVSEAIDDIDDGDLLDVSVVAAGLELVLHGWKLHAGADGSGRPWDVLGTAAQAVVEEFDDLPPMFYTVHAAPDVAEAWLQTVRLVEAIVDRLDTMAGSSSGSAPAWQFATAAARLRAALSVPA